MRLTGQALIVVLDNDVQGAVYSVLVRFGQLAAAVSFVTSSVFVVDGGGIPLIVEIPTPVFENSSMDDLKMNSKKTTKVTVLSGGGEHLLVQLAERLGNPDEVIAIFAPEADVIENIAAKLYRENFRLVTMKVDASKASEAKLAISSLVEQYGGIDAVVAISSEPAAGLIPQVDDDAWHNSLNHNLTSVFKLAKCSIPHLLGTRGSFVSVTSLPATFGSMHMGATAAAMRGVEGLIKSLAIDYARSGVRFNVVACGAMDVSSHGKDKSSWSFTEQPLTRRTVLPRRGTARDIANAVAYLVSSESRFTSGALVQLDGGAGAGYLSRKDFQ